MGGAWRTGGRDIFLFEACEYMDSFLDFEPTVAVILNIEMDHVDYFKSMEHIRASYGRFADIAGKDGVCVANSDDADVMLAIKNYSGKTVTFGIDTDADVRAVNIRTERGRYCFSVLCCGQKYCDVKLSVFGYHNIYNALAAAAVAWLCGLDGDSVSDGLAAFVGAKRRMEYKGRCNGAELYDDYGHHPTEVRATLSGAKDICKGRLWCVFQPHTYSRTSALFDDFANALRVADRVVISDIYAARETDTLGVSAEKLATAIGERAVAADSFERAADILKTELCEGDVAVIMGAGDVWRIFEYMDGEENE